MSIIIRRRFNQIDTLRDYEGEWCTDPRRIKGLVVLDHFKKLFLEETNKKQGLKASLGDFPNLLPEMMMALELPFTKEDIQLGLKEMNPFKAPGPDGFQPFFFQRY